MNTYFTVFATSTCMDSLIYCMLVAVTIWCAWAIGAIELLNKVRLCNLHQLALHEI